MLNQIKTVLLLGLLTALLLVIGTYFGGMPGLTIAFVIVLIMNFGTYWFSDKIVLAMYKAKQVTKKQAPKLHKIVEDLCKKANLPKPKIYIVPTHNPNAFATGRNKDHAAVAVTVGILKLLSKEELKGVLAHELAHAIQYKEKRLYTMSYFDREYEAEQFAYQLTDYANRPLSNQAISHCERMDKKFGFTKHLYKTLAK